MYRLLIFLVLFAISAIGKCENALVIHLELPKIEADPYFRPYVAVWLEDSERKPLKTLALWYQVSSENVEEPDGKKWLKDLRQWWRKLGRNGYESIDAVTGATKRPGVYTIKSSLNQLEDGLYLLNFEAAREEGSRSYKRVEIQVPSRTSQTIEADIELGNITIKSGFE